MANIVYFSRLEIKGNYTFDNSVLGKSIRGQLSNSFSFKLYFPKLPEKTTTISGNDILPDMLIAPDSNVNKWLDDKDWGGIVRNKKDERLVNIKSLLMEVYSDSKVCGIAANNEIDRLVNEKITAVLSILQIRCPNSIRNKHDFEYHDVSFFDEIEACEHLILISWTLPSKTGISLEDVRYAVDNSMRVLSLQYVMIKNAYSFMSDGDYRSVVLCCATAIDVTYREILLRELDRTKILSDEEIEETKGRLKNSSSHGFMCNTWKKMQIDKSIYWDGIESLMKIRNKVIHGGHSPSKKEINGMIEITRNFLEEQKTDLYGS